MDISLEGGYIASMEQPITRSELREELRHYATKEDLAAMETRMVKWMVGMMMGGMAISAAIASVITNLLD